MSLNQRTLASLGAGTFGRLKVHNTSMPNSTPQTITTSQILGGVVSFSTVGNATVLNFPDPSDFIRDPLLNGVDVGDCFPIVVRNQGANNVTVTPLGAASVENAGAANAGRVAPGENILFWIQVTSVAPGSEDYAMRRITV